MASTKRMMTLYDFPLYRKTFLIICCNMFVVKKIKNKFIKKKKMCPFLMVWPVKILAAQKKNAKNKTKKNNKWFWRNSCLWLVTYNVSFFTSKIPQHTWSFSMSDIKMNLAVGSLLCTSALSLSLWWNHTSEEMRNQCLGSTNSLSHPHTTACRFLHPCLKT